MGTGETAEDGDRGNSQNCLRSSAADSDWLEPLALETSQLLLSGRAGIGRPGGGHRARSFAARLKPAGRGVRPGEAGQLASGESRAWARVVGEPPPVPPRLHCVRCAPHLGLRVLLYKTVP